MTTPMRTPVRQYGNTTPVRKATVPGFGGGGHGPSSVGGVLKNMEAVNRQVLATRPGGGPGNQSGGVWISQELWRAIRRQLESKVQEINALVDEHQKVKSDLTEKLNNSNVREYQLDGMVKDMEHALREERIEQERSCQRMVADLEAHKQQIAQEQRERNVTTDQLMRLMKERDELTARGDELAKKLDDVTHELNLEAHRHAMSGGKIASLEKEVQYYQDKHEVDQRRIMELENKNREQSAQISEQHMQIESLKEEMLVMRRPDEAMRDEMSRVQADCRRMTHLLERTAEFKRLMEDMAELKEVHYIPLNECLVEEDLISYPYVPERDREVVLSREAYYWVPKEAFELVQSFLDRLFPRVPVQPFMMLLLQLNKTLHAAEAPRPLHARRMNWMKVWRDHEAQKMAVIRAQHTEEVKKLKRKCMNTKPYTEVVQKGKIQSLQKQLVVSKKTSQKLERYKDMAMKAGKETESKLLLDWGLATIEKLSKQVAESVQENRVLRKRFEGVIRQHGLPPDELIPQLEAKDVMQYGSPSKYIDPMDFVSDAVPTPRSFSPAKSVPMTRSVPSVSTGPRQAWSSKSSSSKVGTSPSKQSSAPSLEHR